MLILGHMRSGKDTMAEILNEEYGISFCSSSMTACNKFIFDELKESHGYQTPIECFNDRVNHRDYWYERICEYNISDRSRLAKEIIKEVDCYVGMRDNDEFMSCYEQNLFDIIIWVDASGRLPLEKGSFNIDKSKVDFIIENNGTLKEFTNKVIRIGKIITNNGQ